MDTNNKERDKHLAHPSFCFSELPPELRESIWKIALNNRKGRVILPIQECATALRSPEASPTGQSYCDDTVCLWPFWFTTRTNFVYRHKSSYELQSIPCFTCVVNREPLLKRYTEMLGKGGYSTQRRINFLCFRKQKDGHTCARGINNKLPL
jgi:hypothetical protein